MLYFSYCSESILDLPNFQYNLNQLQHYRSYYWKQFFQALRGQFEVGKVYWND